MGKTYDIYDEDYFWNLYKEGDIVHISSVSKYFSETSKAAIDRCNCLLGKKLRPAYLVSCPCCRKTIPNVKYHSIENVDKTELKCDDCDIKFIPKVGRDVAIFYEKM